MDDNARMPDQLGNWPVTLGAAWSAGEGPVRISRAESVLMRLKLSIRQKILLALFIVVFLMGVPYVFLIVPGLQYKGQYDAIIQNITAANSINGYVKQEIDAEMWDIVAGKKPFERGQQYRMIDEVNEKVRRMIDNTDSQKGKIKLNVIQRTLESLREKIHQVGAQHK